MDQLSRPTRHRGCSVQWFPHFTVLFYEVVIRSPSIAIPIAKVYSTHLTYCLFSLSFLFHESLSSARLLACLLAVIIFLPVHIGISLSRIIAFAFRDIFLYFSLPIQ